MLRKFLHKTFIILIIYIQVAGFYGCMKEYSYEGGPAIDTIPLPINDTTVKPVNSFPFCPGCSSVNSSTSLLWSFRYDTSLLCGSITNSVITPERNGFTFFGPSTCSTDTGLVMTVFLDLDTLNSNKSNITTNKVILEYYDNTDTSDILISIRHSILFTINTYDHETGIAKGTFTGVVKTKDSTQTSIMAGSYAIQFK